MINGKKVSFFTPPHDEPDLPWVSHSELLKAFLSEVDAAKAAAETRRYKDEGLVAFAAKSDRKVVNIIPHLIAQGLCEALDRWNGHVGGDGPAFPVYCNAAADFARAEYPMSLDYMNAAVKNNGGPILRNITL